MLPVMFPVVSSDVDMLLDPAGLLPRSSLVDAVVMDEVIEFSLRLV